MKGASGLPGPRGASGAPGAVGAKGDNGASPFFATAGSSGAFNCNGLVPHRRRDRRRNPHARLAAESGRCSAWLDVDRLLKLSQPARVYIHASFDYTSPNGASGKDANCYVRDGKGTTLGHNSVYLRIAGGEHTAASLTEVATLPAGPQDIQIWCYSYGTPQLAIQSAGMTVFALAA